MSIEAMVWALTKAQTDNAAEKLVLLSLANFAGRGDEPFSGSYPSVRTIARQAGCSERTVHRHLTSLENKGLICRGNQSMANGIRGDRRPIVWDISGHLRGDNMTGRDVHGVTSVAPRHDTSVIQPLVTNPYNLSSVNPTAATQSPRTDVEELCQRLASLIENNGARKPTVTKKWRDEARRLLDRDKVPFDDAMALIEWCQNDHFWKANILSMPKFREKFDQLKLKAGHLPRPSVGLIDHALATGDVSELIEATGIMYDFRWPGGVMPSDPDERARVRIEFNKKWVADHRGELDARLRRSA